MARNPDRRWRLALLIAVVSAGLHFHRLSEPRSVVFDESWFGEFVNAYVGSGAYFFDIHPPHAKLLVAGAVSLGGYRGDQEFGAIHRPITKVSPALLRTVPALAGTLIPVLVFVLLIQLQASAWGAFLGALAVVLDNALLIQTRILVLDGVLVAATLGALSCYLSGLAAHGVAMRRGWALASGCLVGLAVGTKLTGLTALAMVGLCGLAEWLRDRRLAMLRALAADAVAVTIGALAIYAAGWWLHFALLTQPGPGDRWDAPTGDWLADTLRVHARMWQANVGLTAPHSYGSAWWSWPFMARGVSYWSENGSHLFFLGNPAVWWGASIGLAVVLIAPLLRLVSPVAAGDRLSTWPPRLWIPLCGWTVSYLPLVAVSRVLFLYHYLTPLVFSVCTVALWLDHSGRWTRPGGVRDQRGAVWVTVATLLLGFALISPFTFSFVKAPDYQRAVYTALPGWR